MLQFLDESEADLRALVEADFGPLDAAKDWTLLVLDWLHARARAIPPVPRRVMISYEVNAKRGAYEPAMQEIVEALETGGDLRRRLGKSIRKRSPNHLADPLFNDWQISHFHLGDAAKNARTNDLLFAFVAEDRAVLLDMQPHRKWAMSELLSILLKTSPDDLAKAELKGMAFCSPDYTDAERLRARGARVCLPIMLDGRVFAPPGLGLALSGHAVRFSMGLFPRLRNLRQCLITGVGIARETAEFLTRDVELPIRLGIRIEGARVVAYEKNRHCYLGTLQVLQ